MDKRVSRRSVFKKVLSDGVDAMVRILKEDSVSSTPHLHSDAPMSPDQAGHLLRTRKTTKNNSGIHFCSPQKCESSEQAQDH